MRVKDHYIWLRGSKAFPFRSTIRAMYTALLFFATTMAMSQKENWISEFLAHFEEMISHVLNLVSIPLDWNMICFC